MALGFKPRVSAQASLTCTDLRSPSISGVSASRSKSRSPLTCTTCLERYTPSEGLGARACALQAL
eukprot:7493753-Pyramimonas_sp.AAC.1